MRYNQAREAARVKAIFEKYSRTNAAVLLQYLDYLIDEGIIRTISRDRLMPLHSRCLAVDYSRRYIFDLALFEEHLMQLTHRHMRHPKINKLHFTTWWKSRNIAYVQMN